MVYQNFCNGCKEKSLIKIDTTDLQICKNCLLVSRKINKKFKLTKMSPGWAEEID